VAADVSTGTYRLPAAMYESLLRASRDRAVSINSLEVIDCEDFECWHFDSASAGPEVVVEAVANLTHCVFHALGFGPAHILST
jgi:hypothetical protein